MVTSFYRYHNVKKLDFISVIKNIIDKEKNTKNHIIVGDFNLNIIDTSNSIINDYLNNYFEAGYNPLFNKVTRPCNFDKGPGSCIDNMFFKTSKNSTKIIDHKSIIIQQKFPDHYPILSTFNVKTMSKPIEKSYTYLNKKILIDNCSKTNWNSILKMHDPELATNELINLIQNNINNATKTSKTKKNNNVPRKKWITKAILKSIQVKNKLDKNWKNSKNNILSDEYQVKLLEFKYKSYKKKLDIIILNAKKMYEEELVKKCNTIKKLWQYINLKIKGNKSNKNSHIDYINVNNKRIDDPIKISENFNNFFANIGHNIAKDITKKSEPEFNIVNNNSIFLTKIDETEISKIIMSLNKASGVDKISAVVLKLIAAYVTSPLTYVLNLCVDKGYWPISLKKSEIIPIFKGGDKHDMTNYRPISLISNIAKIFERLIYNRLVNFFEKNNILANNQFGFIGKRGTNDALIKVSEFIYENIDKSKPTIATFLDFKKAFDTVNHDILIHRLRSYGVRGLALDLIISYLKDRTQSVRLKNISSNNCKVNRYTPSNNSWPTFFYSIY